MDKEGFISCRDLRRKEVHDKYGTSWPLEECKMRFKDEKSYFQHLELHELNDNEKYSKLKAFERLKKKERFL